jgi:hypothetical protein
VRYDVAGTGVRNITWEVSGHSIKTTSIDGDFHVAQPLAEIVILGVDKKPERFTVNGKQASDIEYDAKLQRVTVRGLSADLNGECDLSWSF